MTNDQEDLLLMVARIVLRQMQQQPGGETSASSSDDYARETARLLDELKPYDQSDDTDGQPTA